MNSLVDTTAQYAFKIGHNLLFGHFIRGQNVRQAFRIALILLMILLMKQYPKIYK